MMMIMMLSKFMLDECVGGCRGLVLIDMVWATIAQTSAYCKSAMDVAFTFVLTLRRRVLNSSPSYRCDR